jgi:hypothetical protein
VELFFTYLLPRDMRVYDGLQGMQFVAKAVESSQRGGHFSSSTSHLGSRSMKAETETGETTMKKGSRAVIDHLLSAKSRAYASL